MKKELTPKEQVSQDYRVITGHTPFQLIEIEQTNKRANKMQGVMKCHYTPIWDDTDPESPVIDHVNYRVVGGEVNFVENPFHDRKSVGTGRVAFLILDDERVPAGALSGEARGHNLEFLASHYDGGWFKIIDPKIEKMVKKRYEAIIKAKESLSFKHQFDRKYNVRGIGSIDERIKVEVEQPKDVQNMLLEMKKELERSREANKELIEEIANLKGKKSVSSKKEDSVEKDGKVFSFAE